MDELSSAAKAQLAAHNNADLHEAIFRTHDLRFRRDDIAFMGLDGSPPYYAQLVTLEPRASRRQMALLKTLSDEGSPVRAVKDSFCQLDAADLEMEVLLEASWIWRDPAHPYTGASSPTDESGMLPAGWSKVDTAAGLAEWHDAWCSCGSPADETVFPDACLEENSLTFLMRRTAGRIDAGCIANVSRHAVGLSNVFCTHIDDRTFGQAAAAVACIAPNSPIVGYEGNDTLAFAASAGFETVGTLRVLVRAT